MLKKLIFPLLIAAVTLACGFSIKVDRITEDEAIREMLEGRDAVVFGNEEFNANAKASLEKYNMNVQTADSLINALSLAGDGFIELHCYFEGTTVVHAPKPSLLVISDGKTVVECEGGVIFIGFRTVETPDIKVTE